MKNFLAALLLPVVATNLVAADLNVAREALRDGLWQIARQQAEDDRSVEARLIVLESYANEDRWADIKSELATLTAVTNSPQLDFYRAVVDGHREAAIDLLRSSNFPTGEAEAKMMEADLLIKNGDREGARALWREVVALTNVSERAYALAGVNLDDVQVMRQAYEKTLSLPLRRRVGLRLGRLLLRDAATAEEGEKLIRTLVRSKPDAEDAMECFLALAVKAANEKRWEDALAIYDEAVETWPEALKNHEILEGRGEALMRLGRFEESLEDFTRIEQISSDDAVRARSIMRQGDALSELRRGSEAMARYRIVLERYPQTSTAVAMKRIVELREREMRGRDLFKAYQFDEARKVFDEVAEADPSRRSRMKFFNILCLYGVGQDEKAFAEAKELAKSDAPLAVRAETVLWLAKFSYNRNDWKAALQWFSTYAELEPHSASAPEALLWAARAAMALMDYAQAVQLVTTLLERYPRNEVMVPAVLVQAEALIALARYDEALLVLDGIAKSQDVDRMDRLDARMLKADALFAMGADNPVRYEAALEAFRELRFSDDLSADLRMTVGFKTGRVLEKLKRSEDALDVYYSQVISVYHQGLDRDVVFSDESRSILSRTVFRMADIFQDHGKTQQAIAVLKLIADSDLPAAAEAEKRISNIYQKGLFQ